MTVINILAIYYEDGAKLERWLSGKPPTHEERIAEQRMRAIR